MIVYANATGLDIGKLFAAGILPGVLLGICYMVTGVIYAKKRNIPKIPFQGLKHVGKTFIKAIWALLMPLIIIGGILGASSPPPSAASSPRSTASPTAS